MFRTLENFRAGIISPAAFKNMESAKRSQNLQQSQLRDIDSVFSSLINSIQVDNKMGRYMLSGCSDGTIYIHDLFNLSGSSSYTCKAVWKEKQRSPAIQNSSIETVQWYPFDMGLFVTSGLDRILKIWDANTLSPCSKITAKGQIYQHHMCPVPGSNCTIAVASTAHNVVLFDLRVGNCIQELRGHSNGIISCEWSQTDENILASGGSDCRLLVWDIRSSRNCLLSLDENNENAFTDRKKTNKAHDGYVSSVRFIDNGVSLVSYGTDNSLRLWNVIKGTNQKVDFKKVKNNRKKKVQIDVSSPNSNSGVIYVPSGGNIYVFEIKTGNLVNTLTGHFNKTNCCYFDPIYLYLYSGGYDQQILVWCDENIQRAAYVDSKKPSNPTGRPERNRKTVVPEQSLFEDAWSDDDS